jgi:hypothetical protein
MNILFTRKYTYTVNAAVDDVRTDLAKIMHAPGHEGSKNIAGTLNDDNSFNLTQKLPFGPNKIDSPNGIAYLSGTIRQEGDKTIIETILKPNTGFVLMFYLLIILFGRVLLGNIRIEGSNMVLFLILLFVWLFVFRLLFTITNGLRNRFERLLQLRRENKSPG